MKYEYYLSPIDKPIDYYIGKIMLDEKPFIGQWLRVNSNICSIVAIINFHTLKIKNEII